MVCDGFVWKTRPGAWEVEPPVAGRGPWSTTVTSCQPSCVRWSATLQPTMPAPTTTTRLPLPIPQPFLSGERHHSKRRSRRDPWLPDGLVLLGPLRRGRVRLHALVGDQGGHVVLLLVGQLEALEQLVGLGVAAGELGAERLVQ